MLGLALLGGCQDSEPKAKEPSMQSVQETGETSKGTSFPYPHLLSESNMSYSLLVIGEQDEESPIEKNIKITVHVTDILSLPTLEMAQKAYPKLNISKEPTYLLFDNSSVILQTTDIKELTSFLDKNKAK